MSPASRTPQFLENTAMGLIAMPVAWERLDVEAGIGRPGSPMRAPNPRAS
jgi:hypothetical protein